MIDRRQFLIGAPLVLSTPSISIQPTGRTIGQPMRDEWVKGYTQAQLDDAQARYKLRFPPDLIAMYLDRRPAGGWDWTRDHRKIREMLAWPLEGLWLDVQSNFLWWPEWGQKPKDSKEQYAVLRAVVERAPKLIPIYSHRYIPEEPHESGNPVFSVYQSDIVYYGSDLADYFDHELNRNSNRDPMTNVKHIRFWSDMVERYGERSAE
jgi:hypothetical protein